MLFNQKQKEKNEKKEAKLRLFAEAKLRLFEETQFLLFGRKGTRVNAWVSFFLLKRKKDKQMDYTEEILDNYQELKTKHPRAAAELLDKFGEGKWQEYAIFWYPTKEDYAAYELEDGWYSDFGLNENTDFYGAPNLLDFIDFASLADVLIDTWDDSSKYQTEFGGIVASAWGF